MTAPTVDIVTVNFNSSAYLPDYFRALSALDYPRDRWRVVMVDNGSKDGSLERLPEWGACVPLQIRPLHRNAGVAGGNNAGISAGTSDYVALLNPDTRVTPGWLRAMVDRTEREADIGLVEARQIPTELDKYSDPETGDTSWASTGGALVRRRALEQVGPFDERFFMYEDDVDLCWRLWLGGWRCVYDRDAVYEHRPHDERKLSPFLWLHIFRNAVYMRYIYGSPRLAAAHLCRGVLRAARSRRPELARPTVRAVQDVAAALPWLRARRRAAVGATCSWVGLFDSPFIPQSVPGT
jgi:GT2 family glycosyltransferase